MVDFKIVMSDPKTGKSSNKEVKDDAASIFMGKNIGDKVKGESFDMNGFEFEITGASDNCGFPLRKDVNVPRKQILAVEGVGLKKKSAGIRQRKTVCGGKINNDISQVNLKIVKYGKVKAEAKEYVKADEKTEAKKEEPKAEVKEEAKKEKPKAEVKEESKEKPEEKKE
jgi:small subunit ribosomal protein S6e